MAINIQNQADPYPLSKREQREYHAAKHGSWGDMNPVTRKVESKKVCGTVIYNGNVNVVR